LGQQCKQLPYSPPPRQFTQYSNRGVKGMVVGSLKSPRTHEDARLAAALGLVGFSEVHAHA
jgi:hypothetical protein